ncbi:MAG: transcriptional repressor [Muribaculaceae bacterium]|nr:transcriptional repressor [Muribaculaceae bacterium]
MERLDNYSDVRITEMIHERGMRPSVQRIAVMSFVANAGSHPTADEIYGTLSEKFPSLSRTTIYNSLHALVDAGLIRELEIESGNRRYDLAPQPPHSHFVCRRCGKIVDMALPERLKDSATPGYMIDSVDLYFKGICPDCSIKINN